MTTQGRIMTLTQQWRQLNLIGNSFYILFSAKGIVSYRQIISSRPYVRLQCTYSLPRRVLSNTPVNKLNSGNVKYLKIPKKQRGPHKTPSLTICDLRVLELCVAHMWGIRFSRKWISKFLWWRFCFLNLLIIVFYLWTGALVFVRQADQQQPWSAGKRHTSRRKWLPTK